MAFNSTIVFVIDNSASMNQQCNLGQSLLNVAKNSIENFIKKRGRSDDRYILLTLGDRKTSVLSGMKDAANHQLVLTRLRNIQANGFTSLGQTLKVAFDLINLPRLHHKLDSYGLGRNPYHSQPAMVVCVTDGCKLSTLSTVEDKLHIPTTDPLPGHELTHEPFRWDCRVFSLVLKIPGSFDVNPGIPLQQSNHPVSVICDVTGGRSYLVTNKTTLLQSFDQLNTKIQRGVVIKFERAINTKVVQTSNNVTVHDPCPQGEQQVKDNFQNSTRLVMIKNPVQGQKIVQSNWPIPESYFGLIGNSIPKRMAHPVLKFVQKDEKVMLMLDFAFDKYELESSALSSLMVEKLNQYSCWYVYVENSGAKSGIHHLCGFLKLSSPNQQGERKAQLYIMPYNFHRLIPLLVELKAIIQKKLYNSTDLIGRINDYAKRCPVYYLHYLIKAMRAFLSKVGLGPMQIDHMIRDMIPSDQEYKCQVNECMKGICDQIRTYPEFASHPPDNYLKGVLVDQTSSKFKVEINEVKELANFRVGWLSKSKSNFYFDAFATSRGSLLNQVESMNLNLQQLLHSSFRIEGEMIGDVNFSSSRIKLQDKRDLHTKLVKDMGDYKALESNPVLNKIRLRSAQVDLDGDSRSKNTFGNPFTNKRREDKLGILDETEDYDIIQKAEKKTRRRKNNLNTILAKHYKTKNVHKKFVRITRTPDPESTQYSDDSDFDQVSINSEPPLDYNRSDDFLDELDDFKPVVPEKSQFKPIVPEFKPIKDNITQKRKSPVVVNDPPTKKSKILCKPKSIEDISAEDLSKLRNEAISVIKNWGSSYKKIELMLKTVSTKKGENKNKLINVISFWATEFKRMGIKNLIAKYIEV